MDNIVAQLQDTFEGQIVSLTEVHLWLNTNTILTEFIYLEGFPRPTPRRNTFDDSSDYIRGKYYTRNLQSNALTLTLHPSIQLSPSCPKKEERKKDIGANFRSH